MPFFLNPFTLYSLALSFVLLLYSLQWSTLLPNLSIPLVSFLIFTIFVSYVLALVTKKEISYQYRFKNAHRKKVTKKDILFFLIVSFVMYGQFIYEGRVPFFGIFSNMTGENKGFGIPILSLLALSFGSVLSSVFFDFYLQSKNKWFLFFIIVILLSFLLMLNRGAILVALIQFTIIYFFRRKLSIKSTLINIAFLFFLMYLFGLAGNLRENHTKTEINKITSDYIQVLGGASDNFIDSSIPKELFWGYLYSTTPIANLQNNINYSSNSMSFVDLVINEFLPDFVSKRINQIYSSSKTSNIRISTAFTVGTIYGKSYIHFGWLGVILMFVYFSSILFFFLKVSRFHSKTVITIAVLGSISIFSLFTNVITYSAISLQLIWAILLQKSYK